MAISLKHCNTELNEFVLQKVALNKMPQAAADLANIKIAEVYSFNSLLNEIAMFCGVPAVIHSNHLVALDHFHTFIYYQETMERGAF